MQAVTEQTWTDLTASGLVVVECGTAWCAPCRALEPLLERAAITYEGRARFLKLDGDADPETLRRFGVMGFPTLIILREGEALGAHAAGNVRSLAQLAALIDPHR